MEYQALPFQNLLDNEYEFAMICFVERNAKLPKGRRNKTTGNGWLCDTYTGAKGLDFFLASVKGMMVQYRIPLLKYFQEYAVSLLFFPDFCCIDARGGGVTIGDSLICGGRFQC